MAFSIQNPLYPKPAYASSTALTDQRLTVDNTAGGVQFAAFSDLADLIVLDIQDADVMCTFDGSAPTTTNGHRLYQGQAYTWARATAAAAKFIRQAATSAAIQASQFQI